MTRLYHAQVPRYCTTFQLWPWEVLQPSRRPRAVCDSSVFCKHILARGLMCVDLSSSRLRTDSSDQFPIQKCLSPRSLISTRRSPHSQECKDPHWRRLCDWWPWPFTFWQQNKWISRTHLGTSLCQVWWSYSCIIFEISYETTDRHTNKPEVKTVPPDCRGWLDV